MTRFEYKVVPAPTSGLKAKGVKSSEARFANALETLMNELGQDGWDYVRADTLPCEERSGLTGRVTKYQNMLVFRRARDTGAERAPVAGLLEAPAPVAAASTAAPEARVPAPSAEAHGSGEPPLHRPDGAEAESGEAAARAAAAAFRNVRGTEPSLSREAPAKPGADVAAE